jgi:hypothetical protein
MTGTRRALVLIGLTLTVMIGAAIPASATFTDSATVTTTVGTGTVAAPTALKVTNSCVTTTTTVRRTTYTNPWTGATTQTSYSSWTTRAASNTNVQGTTTTTVAGPGANETTTTTVTRNTDLHVTLSWSASTSRGVTGYAVSAHLGPYNSVAPLLSTDAATTSVSRIEDADMLSYQPSLFVTTQTSYGWTADSVRTAVLSC